MDQKTNRAESINARRRCQQGVRRDAPFPGQDEAACFGERGAYLCNPHAFPISTATSGTSPRPTTQHQSPRVSGMVLKIG